MENKLKEQNRDVIYQVSLLQSLAYGDYCGSVTVKELKQHGDVGIGTFNKLNGELIMLDGAAYRAAGDGSVELVSDDETSPFSVVTYMDADETRSFKDIPDFDVRQPSAFEQIKTITGDVFGWVEKNQGKLLDAYNLFQSIRGGQPINIPSGPVDGIPPIPE